MYPPPANLIEKPTGFFETVGSTISDGWNVISSRSYLLYTMITETFFRTIGYFAPQLANALELMWGRVREIYHRIVSDSLERQVNQLISEKLELEERVNGYAQENQRLALENNELRLRYSSEINSIRTLYQQEGSNCELLCNSLEEFRGFLNERSPEIEQSASSLVSDQLIPLQQQYIDSLLQKLQTETSNQARSLACEEILRVFGRYNSHFGKIFNILLLIKSLRTPLTYQI